MIDIFLNRLDVISILKKNYNRIVMKKESKKTEYMSIPVCNSEKVTQLQNKATILAEKKSFKEAISTYLSSVFIDKNNPKTYLGLGICYKNAGKIQKAIKALEKAALLDPDNYEIFFNLGQCHLEDEVPCKAIKCFIRALQIEPDNPEGIYHLGLAHEACDEPDMAIMIYQKLIECSPTYINAYLKKSELLIKTQQYDNALDLYKKVIKLILIILKHILI